MSIEVKTFCGGRKDSGRKLRTHILDLLTDGQSQVDLDFGGIDGISHAFADELFGLLALHFGANFIDKKINLLNTNDAIKASINFAIKERVKKQNKGVTNATSTF